MSYSRYRRIATAAATGSDASPKRTRYQAALLSVVTATRNAATKTETAKRNHFNCWRSTPRDRIESQDDRRERQHAEDDRDREVQPGDQTGDLPEWAGYPKRIGELRLIAVGRVGHDRHRDGRDPKPDASEPGDRPPARPREVSIREQQRDPDERETERGQAHPAADPIDEAHARQVGVREESPADIFRREDREDESDTTEQEQPADGVARPQDRQHRSDRRQCHEHAARSQEVGDAHRIVGQQGSVRQDGRCQAERDHRQGEDEQRGSDPPRPPTARRTAHRASSGRSHRESVVGAIASRTVVSRSAVTVGRSTSFRSRDENAIVVDSAS